jgi:hypothetical protein
MAVDSVATNPTRQSRPLAVGALANEELANRDSRLSRSRVRVRTGLRH